MKRAGIERSFLFVSANDPVRLPKALASAADAVIVDLEDSVAETEKQSARQGLSAGLRAGLAGGPKPVWLRVNGMGTPHCFADLGAAVSNGIRGLVIPKVESPEEVWCVDWVLQQLEREFEVPLQTVKLICIIESARGLARVNEIARTSSRIDRLMFGAVDLAADMAADFASDDEALRTARFEVARASRLADLPGPIDTAFILTAEPERLRSSAASAKTLGYTAKVCIHPNQVAIVNQVFHPTPAQIALAQKIVTAFADAERAGKAALLVEGVMVDYPVATRARQLLASIKQH